MELNYIIIQAGGLGTRLEHYTRNRPKSLVPVQNKPILFHMFDRFPKKKFIVIGDYKFDILERYLRNFANAEYILVHAEGKGNGAGIKKALEFLPDGEPFMVVWSDLILSNDLILPTESEGGFVGVTDQFPCSWKFESGELKKENSEGKNGVAGCFVFSDKKLLKDLPKEGSFTGFLKESDIPLKALDMGSSFEVGTIQALRKHDSTENRCRPYNHMEFDGEKVIKTGLTEEGRKLIQREERWYEKVTEYGFSGIPQIYGFEPLTMKRIHGDNIFKASLSNEEKRKTIDRIVTALNTLHNYEKAAPDFYGLEEDYYTKTLKRLHSIREVLPFSNDESILINGVSCKNVLTNEEAFHSDVRENLFSADFGPIHGDCTLTNTMSDDQGQIYFIDARGYFGKREIFGDVYYDWAKIYYSLEGCFDQFNVKNFDLSINQDSVEFNIGSSGWEFLTPYFLEKIPDCNVSKIRLIHAIVWLSLASHCWEDYDSMCLAYYNGLLLWNQWIKDYRKGE